MDVFVTVVTIIALPPCWVLWWADAYASGLRMGKQSWQRLLPWTDLLPRLKTHGIWEPKHLLRGNELAANISRSASDKCMNIPTATWDPILAIEYMCDPEFLQALLWKCGPRLLCSNILCESGLASSFWSPIQNPPRTADSAVFPNHLRQVFRMEDLIHHSSAFRVAHEVSRPQTCPVWHTGETCLSR